jgi:response regulator RpfG family c-di-GMP phosphodiesterase
MKTIFQWTMAVVTILHVTVTYNVLFSEAAKDVLEILKVLFVSDVGRDILLRTILLGLFMIVLYSIVSIGEFMQEERKNELIKRRQVQEDFTNVVTKIFDVTLDRASRNNDDYENIIIVSKMASNLARLLNLSETEVNEIEQIAKIHVEKQVNFISTAGGNEDEKFALLKEQTDLGSIIISRLQLERKCEDIIRSTFEGSNNDEFVKRMKKIQNEVSSQIILICELYVSMRSIKSYKKAYNHKLTIQYMTDQFRVYFDGDIFEHFLRFKDQFEEIYENDKGE